MKTKLTLILLVISIGTMLAQPGRSKVARSPEYFLDWRPGYVNITELTGGPGLSGTTDPFSKYYYGITTVNGYQFTRNLKAGIGVGIHIHNEGTLFPLFLDTRYSFNAQEFVPFIAAAGGLAMNFNDLAERSWLFINPSVGIRWIVARRTGISFSAGIMSMAGDGTRNSFISFKLGMELKGR